MFNHLLTLTKKVNKIMNLSAQIANETESIPAFNLCYTIVLGKPAGENVGIIKQNEGGYHLTNYDWGIGEEAQATARHANDLRGIDAKTQLEYEMKSMFVWK